MAETPIHTSTTENPAPPALPRGRIVILGSSLSLGALLAWIAVLALLGVVALGLLRAQQGPVAEGQRAPDFILTTFDDQEYRLKDLKNKVVLINFWASWCKPCEEEAGFLEEAWRYYQAHGGVVFLGVDYVDTEPEALAYLKKFNITYPNGPDLGTRVSQAYRIRGVPETYIVGRDGKLSKVLIGGFTSVEQIKSFVDPLLTEN